ncbi:hypothetical protein TNCV_478891 [Trichonephila clavipes]|nr:hypothetical protein TNCV_478891 [Trichonephila clavipes]
MEGLKLTILNELGVHPYHPTSVHALKVGYNQRRYDWSNFRHEQLGVPTNADIIWTDEACFARNTTHNEQNIYFWSLNNHNCAFKVRHQVHWSINV